MNGLCPDEFKAFYEKIQLGPKQEERIFSAATTLHDYLVKEYGLPTDQVFIQGSFANGTAIKPDPERSGGEYDVDLIVVCAKPEASEQKALDDVAETLAKNGNYADRIKRSSSSPAIRLEYADDEIGAFHVDVVPARECASAPLEVPRLDCGWRPTAPREYAAWAQQPENIPEIVQMIKRWRDHHQSARSAVKSIVLQVLIAEQHFGGTSDASKVCGALQGVTTFLDAYPNHAPEIWNPALPSENLADGWSDADYTQFRHEIGEAFRIAEAAINADSVDRARELWRKLFGNDFPGPSDSRGSLTPPPPPADAKRSKPQTARRNVEWG